MNFKPVPPRICLPPQWVAEDTWMVQQVQEALGAPLCVNINSLVIAGAEPVLVDTGSPANRRQWLEDTFSLVDPSDVAYVFLSHDDIDHTGNLAEVLTLCPQAILVASWAIVERHTCAVEFPLARCRWLESGDTLQLSDRTLSLVRPPTFDSPTTRGLFDHKTRMYWAADSFATPSTQAIEPTVDELDLDFWRQGRSMFAHHALSPWLAMVDADRYRGAVRSVQALGMTAIAAAHTPLITEASVPTAFDLTVALARQPAPPVPDQHALDAIVAALGEAA
jgi:flavorubredoxin